ncbi:prolyl oligopeptidase family serine peptidase, partial [Streptomyces sp. NPDC005070]
GRAFISVANRDKRSMIFLGAPTGSVPELAREASPITHVRADAPPMLVMHGDRDAMVPYSQSTTFVSAQIASGGTAELVLVPGAGHFWDGAEDPSALHRQAIRFLRGLAEA